MGWEQQTAIYTVRLSYQTLPTQNLNIKYLAVGNVLRIAVSIRKPGYLTTYVPSAV